MPAKKSGKKGLLAGLVAALVFGGAGYYATGSGILTGVASEGAADANGHIAVATSPVSRVAFVALEPMVLSLGSDARSRYLNFSAHLEVLPEYAAEISHLKPRFQDVLNTYLRAVTEHDLESPAALSRLRAQMLRRLQIVAGNDRIRDLLITEFVLSKG